MKKHLAILAKSAVEAIFAGQKTIETRFSQKKIAPFNQVEIGDIVYLKIPGKEIVGQFRVKKILTFAGMEPEDFDDLFKKYGPKIASFDQNFDQKYQKDKRNCKFGTLIFIANCERFITSPIRIKKKDLRGWVVLQA